MYLTEIKISENRPVKAPNNMKNEVNALLFAWELARKNCLKGNLASSSYACGLILDDDTVYFGVNFNHTRNEISSICAERLAILNTFNEQVKNYTIDARFDYKIKYILIANYINDDIYWSDKVTPCADCLSWFNTGANLSSETKILSLKKNIKNEVYLDIQDLALFLPLRDLTFEIPKKDLKIEDKKLQNLYNATLEAYKENTLTKTSGQNIAAGVLANGKIFTGQKIDYSKRWFTEPLEFACAKAIEKFKTDTKIEALCYIGEEYTITETGQKTKDGLLSIKTLGRLCTRFATHDTIVLTVSNGEIQKRKIGDFLPDEHKFIHDYEIS